MRRGRRRRRRAGSGSGARALALALALALGGAACGELNGPTLVTLDADDGVPPIDVMGAVVSGVDVAACTGTEMVDRYTVTYTETGTGGCTISLLETVEVFSEEDARAASDALGGQTILGVSGIRLSVDAFSISDAASGAAYDLGPGNVEETRLVVDGVSIEVNLAGPFPPSQEVALGAPTVETVRDSIGTGTSASAVVDIVVTLSAAGRASFPPDIAIDFSGQPIVDLAVVIE